MMPPQRNIQARRSPTYDLFGNRCSTVTKRSLTTENIPPHTLGFSRTNMIDLTTDGEADAIVLLDDDTDEEACGHNDEEDESRSSSPSLLDAAIYESDLTGSDIMSVDDDNQDQGQESDDDEGFSLVIAGGRSHQPGNLEILARSIVVDSDDDEDEDEVSEIEYHEIHDDVPGIDELLAHQIHQLALNGDAFSLACADTIRFVPSFQANRSTVCARGKGVELEDGSFLQIELTYHAHGQDFVVGKHLIRQKSIKRYMPPHRNELVWNITRNTRQLMHSTSITRPASDIVRNREIVFTNQLFPAASYQTDSRSFDDPHQDLRHGPLFCRWKRTVVVADKHIEEERFESLRLTEADNHTRRDQAGVLYRTRITNDGLRMQWREFAIIRGGSHREERQVIDIDGGTESQPVFVNQTYTFGDSFCGAGGTSMGAVTARLHLIWSFDMDKEAADTYRANFFRHGAAVYCKAVHDFLLNNHASYVDILHISPPCQPFSPAHTIPSRERDERNQAALFSILQLVEKVKPRIVTVEQTFGLKSRHKEWFAAVINIFISLNYSVGFKIIRCQEYGVPQTRKRLVIIASGLGEKLPDFPKPTHGTELRPFVTIDDAIATIPRRAPDHDTSPRFRDGPKAPFVGNIQAKTLTCSGGVGNYHPSGIRPYTVREIASLQTFPRDFSFVGANTQTAARKQIGNAVPPVLAQLIFESIVASLRETDRENGWY